MGIMSSKPKCPPQYTYSKNSNRCLHESELSLSTNVDPLKSECKCATCEGQNSLLIIGSLLAIIALFIIITIIVYANSV